MTCWPKTSALASTARLRLQVQAAGYDQVGVDVRQRFPNDRTLLVAMGLRLAQSEYDDIRRTGGYPDYHEDLAHPVCAGQLLRGRPAGAGAGRAARAGDWGAGGAGAVP